MNKKSNHNINPRKTANGRGCLATPAIARTAHYYSQYYDGYSVLSPLASAADYHQHFREAHLKL